MSTDGERAARLAQTRKRSKVLSPERRKTRRARARAKYVANGSSEEQGEAGGAATGTTGQAVAGGSGC